MSGVAPLVERARRAPPIVQDSALALVLFGIGLADFALTNPEDLPSGWRIGPGSVALLVIAAGSLVVRRRWVWMTFVVFQVCVAVVIATGLEGVAGIGGFLMATVVVYSVAEQARGSISALAA